ncbi:MAG: hypothetical protein QXL85_08330 [Candidatus Bathyarchaeia archaeon]
MPIHILGAFAFGCLAGALRETSDIYISASLHGGIMTSYTFLSIYTSELILNISLFISWFIFFYLLAIFFHESENPKPRAMGEQSDEMRATQRKDNCKPPKVYAEGRAAILNRLPLAYRS